LKEVEGSVLPMLEIKEQTLEVEMAEEMPPTYADEFKIRQVFLNLISNAYKFSPRKGKIRVVCGLAKPHLLHCSVVDQGIGISASDQRKLFEEFSQVGRGAVPGKGGLGLVWLSPRSWWSCMAETSGWIVSWVRGARLPFPSPLPMERALK